MYDAPRNAVDELIAQGMAAIEESFLMAKASQPKGQQDDEDLDDDFNPFDKSKKASDAAEDDDSDEDKKKKARKKGSDGTKDGDPDSGGGSDDDDDSDDPDDGDDEPDWNGGKKMSKADQGYVEVDATALLQAIDDKLSLVPELLERLGVLEAQNATLAKAVQASATGAHTMAKAMQGVLGLPSTPKSQTRAVVPTRAAEAPASGMSRQQVMAKALQACEAGTLSIEDVGTLEVLTNQGGVDRALEQLPRVKQIITGGN